MPGKVTTTWNGDLMLREVLSDVRGALVQAGTAMVSTARQIEEPHAITGRLVNGIRFRVSRQGGRWSLRFVSEAPYSFWVNNGHRTFRGRHYMDTAWDRHVGDVKRNLASAGGTRIRTYRVHRIPTRRAA